MSTTVQIPDAPATETAPDSSVEVKDGGAVEVSVSTEAPKSGERPAWLPPEFKTPEEMAAKFAELTKAPEKPVVSKIVTPEQATAEAVKAGVDLAKLGAELVDKGELSAESVTLLKSKGIDPAVVDLYVEGAQAQATLELNALAAHVGGMESLQAMLNWGATGLLADEAKAYNEMLGSGNQAQAKIALDGLRSRYESVNGSLATQTITGETRPTSVGPAPFKSLAEQTKAMRDPQYQKDPAYREQIQRRLAVSPDFAPISHS